MLSDCTVREEGCCLSMDGCCAVKGGCCAVKEGGVVARVGCCAVKLGCCTVKDGGTAVVSVMAIGRVVVRNGVVSVVHAPAAGVVLAVALVDVALLERAPVEAVLPAVGQTAMSGMMLLPSMSVGVGLSCAEDGAMSIMIIKMITPAGLDGLEVITTLKRGMAVREATATSPRT